jgi:hypothetical protein
MRSAEGGAPYKTIPLVFSGFADAQRAPLQSIFPTSLKIDGRSDKQRTKSLIWIAMLYAALL